MNDKDEVVLAKESLERIERIARLHGRSVLTMPDKEVEFLLEIYKEGAIHALLALKNLEEQP